MFIDFIYIYMYIICIHIYIFFSIYTAYITHIFPNAGDPPRMVDFMTTGQRNLRAPAMPGRWKNGTIFPMFFFGLGCIS